MDWKKLKSQMGYQDALVPENVRLKEPSQDDVLPHDPNASVLENLGRFGISNMAKDPGYSNMMPAVGSVKKVVRGVFDPENLEHISALKPHLERVLPHALEDDYHSGEVIAEILKDKNLSRSASILRDGKVKEALKDAGFEGVMDKLSPSLPSRFSTLTAENPGAKALSPEENAKRMSQLIDELKMRGIDFSPVEGNYGGMTEKSLLVPHTKTFGQAEANELGKQFGQESVVHKLDHQNILDYLSGPNAGKYNLGEGINVNPDLAENFSKVGDQKYQLNLDFDKLHEAQKQQEVFEQLKKILKDETGE